MAVVTGFYRTCVIDAVLEHSPVGDRSTRGATPIR
jgi:hypothetical protein